MFSDQLPRSKAPEPERVLSQPLSAPGPWPASSAPAHPRPAAPLVRECTLGFHNQPLGSVI